MKKLVFIATAFVLFFCINGNARADLLATVDFTPSGGTASTSVIGANFNAYFEEDLTSTIFASLFVDPSDVGTEFFATSSSGISPDAGFDKFAEYLTNGSDNELWLGFKLLPSEGGGASFDFESEYFDTSPDFLGCTIASIGLEINSFSLESPGSDPNQDGVWTDFSFNVKYNIYGQCNNSRVPEPATMLLFSAGLAGLGAFRKKFKKQ
jgi:hypothetical protein